MHEELNYKRIKHLLDFLCHLVESYSKEFQL